MSGYESDGYHNETLITSNYSGALDNNSPTFSRDGTSDIWYYEAIQAIPKRTGNYTFKSYSAIDSYGYLYANPFDPLNIASNLLASSDDDETGIDDQFSMSYPLEAGANYNLIFTTFDRSLTGRFFIVVSGPARVILRSMNTTLKQSSTTTSTTVASRYVTDQNTDVTYGNTVVIDPNIDVTDANTDVTDPNTDVTYGNTVVTDPNIDVTHGDTGVTDPNIDVTDANTNVTDPNTDVTDSNTGATDPNVGVVNPNTENLGF
ncbi:unnamed protein product [Rotaria socialis]|uniref:Uncharacterized protein n=1 Tax=Rotaria socialis TaxID=392032 RepID=A0A817NGA0_9BILA|nr:unnamed protein product [Rotaria socialis]CAF4330417.1 unnamed protein product [Rotaria socialis]